MILPFFEPPLNGDEIEALVWHLSSKRDDRTLTYQNLEAEMLGFVPTLAGDILWQLEMGGSPALNRLVVAADDDGDKDLANKSSQIGNAGL